ncbi:MAG TPA: tetratricopeptide repeat protein [Herpetosiphonaceae bacterium]
MPPIYETRLIVKSTDSGYRASWTASDNQESEEFSLTLPLTPQNTADLRWYLETYMQFPGAGDHARAKGIEDQLKAWGRQLFDAIFDNSEGTKVYVKLMDTASKRKRRCLLTIGATDPDILVQPWEMLRDQHGPLTLQGVTIRRQLRGATLPDDQPLKLPLRVLLIVSRPSDVGFIDPRNSIRPLLDALEDLPPGQVDIDFCDPPTLAQLERMISEANTARQPYHIVHFDGHGTYLPNTGVGALAFENDDGKLALVAGSTLGDIMVQLKVPLILLEACRSSDLSNQPVFGSVAPALLESGVGSVIAFSHSIHVKAARLFVERFYQELVAGLTIGQALEKARGQLRAVPDRWLHLGPDAETIQLQDWFVPQLYQIGADPVLIKPTRKTTTQAAPRPASDRQPLFGFPPEPLYRFHGRELELLELERAFRRYPAVLLSGMGGMGKTALAREAASWWLRKGMFDAAIFCSFEQKAGAERVVQLIGQALAGDEFSARSNEEQWTAAVDLFRRRRVLLVWDNFESTLPAYQQGEEQESALSFGPEARARLTQLYRELTGGTPQPQGRLLVTCRPDETALPGIKDVPLAGLARPDSLHLLKAVLDLKSIVIDQPGRERPGYERHEIDALLDDLQDHPLSIELVAPHLKTMTPQRIRDEFGVLLQRFADENAPEGRNRSLLASLEFSKRRLSPEAQAVLPYLAWFEGGVFEQILLAFTELDPAQWEAIRAELVATALVKVEELPQFSTPYLRFHPTLPYAASPTDVADVEVTEQRFISVYSQVREIVYNALYGDQPAAGMILLAHEEANFREAITRSFRQGDRQEGAWMADTLRNYLERAGRLRERDALVEWVRTQLPDGDHLDIATCESIQQHAWSQFTQGHAVEAIQMIQALINRLESEGLANGGDPTFQIALSYGHLGRIYYNAGRSDLSVEPLDKSIARFKQLGDSGRHNLSAVLGDLANAYRNMGQLSLALEAAESGLAISRDLRSFREGGVSLVQIGAILIAQQRYAEAETRYDEALKAAQAAGDVGLQGIIFQHQGTLQLNLGNYDRAVGLYKQAITFFQQANNLSSEMRTYNSIANVERKRNHLDAAEAWYKRSHELATQLNDKYQLSAIAQNLGILYERRAEQATNSIIRTALLHQAVASVEESLNIDLDRQDQVGIASSYSQLGILHRLLGELDRAEKNMLQSLKIRELLNLPDVYKDYWILADIARDRADTEAAAMWQAKYEAKVAELERLRRGEGTEAQDSGKR